MKELAKSIAKHLKEPLCVFDIETSSADTKTCEILELSILKIYPDASTESVNILCKNKKPIPKEATAIHGISEEDLKDAKYFEEYIPLIIITLSGSSLASYNGISFDAEVLGRHLEESGSKFSIDKLFHYDAFPVYKKDSPRKLADALKFYTGEELKDAHEAENDVLATAAIIAKQLEKNDGLSLEEIAKKYEIQKLSRFISVDKDGQECIAIGKWKGTKMSEVDPSYLTWIINKSDMPKGFKDYCQGVVDAKNIKKTSAIRN